MRLQEIFFSASHEERSNFFEYVISKSINKFCAKGSIAIDAGANGGSHTISMASAVGGEGIVHAFEPNPLVNKGIVDSQKKYPWIRLHEVALSNTAGRMPFYLSAEPGMGSLLLRPHMEQVGYDVSYHGELEVEVSTLDQVMGAAQELSKISFIKCDIEGEEFRFLQGADQTIKKHRPIIMLEIDENISVRCSRLLRGLPPDPIDWFNDMRELYKWFSNVGGKNVIYDFFGDVLVDCVPMQNWCIAIIPAEKDPSSVGEFIKSTANNFWLKDKNWRI